MGMTREQRAERDARIAKHNTMMAAAADERERFNLAVQALPADRKPILSTAFGPYVVYGVSADWWYTTYPQGATPGWLTARSFCGCNDGKWADLLRDAGVERHPLFAAPAPPAR